MPNQWELPAGLLKYASMKQNSGSLPSGLAQYNSMRPEQGLLSDIQRSIQDVPAYQLGPSDIPHYDNQVEKWLNEHLGGSSDAPEPEFKIQGEITLDPEQGVVAQPISSDYDLYTPTEQNRRYGRMGLDKDRAPWNEVKEWIPEEQAKDIPGFKMGETFQAEDGTWYTFDSGNTNWQVVDNSGYLKPAEGGDLWTPYVDDWVYGDLPKPAGRADKMLGKNMAQGPTETIGSFVNPIINRHIEYLNQNLTPEQKQRAIDAGVEPLELDYSIDDWNLENQLVGSGENNLGPLPQSIYNDINDWTRNLLEAAGAQGIEERALPSGLLEVI